MVAGENYLKERGDWVVVGYSLGPDQVCGGHSVLWTERWWSVPHLVSTRRLEAVVVWTLLVAWGRGRFQGDVAPSSLRPNVEFKLNIIDSGI